jgi:hypothetical protein
MHTETLELFHDCNGTQWRVEMHYPAGKAKGNDRYWIATITKDGAPKPALTCANMMQLDHEVRRLRQPTLQMGEQFPRS